MPDYFQFSKTITFTHNPTVTFLVGYRFGGVEGARFCILSSLLDQLNHDKTIDVYHLCKLYHKKRPGIVGSPEDYLYIFLAMSGYIQEQFERETASLSHHLQLRSSSAKKNGTLPRSPSLQARVETTIWNVNNYEELLCGCMWRVYTNRTQWYIYSSLIVSVMEYRELPNIRQWVFFPWRWFLIFFTHTIMDASTHVIE